MIVNHVSRLMGERRLNIQTVHKGTGLAYSVVAELYHGKTKRFDQETLNKLCAYFKVGVGDILEYRPNAAAGAGAG